MQRSYSFEFFPPKTPEGAEKLRATRAELIALGPDFVSVTFGAGGTTREGTLAATLDIIAEGTPCAPHLSCVGSTRAGIRDILTEYRDAGVKRIVALRGDMPSGWGEIGEFRYANELVEFIRAETGRHFHIEVAAYPEVHPQARSASADLTNFVRKVNAGADSAITQMFFNADAYFRFVDDARRAGVTVPIVPGIMPITNFTSLRRFSEGCGAELPRWIGERLRDYGDDLASIRAFGLDVMTALCERLLAADVPGLHFYTLNAAGPVKGLWSRLGLQGRAANSSGINS